ncbi:hypothetical protein V6N12_073712 [Hibiscus sabdariffa]|uniref:Uncharacterized protein n=1 Tax=Hibiscus sabdariffa TaxID=183260 RepID=A0ABR2CT84_9ROSI
MGRMGLEPISFFLLTRSVSKGRADLFFSTLLDRMVGLKRVGLSLGPGSPIEPNPVCGDAARLDYDGEAAWWIWRLLVKVSCG